MPVIPIRGVHLDLKGLPPTRPRLLELLALFAAARFNCLLVEWEDAFPWTCDARFRSETAYTLDDVDAFHHRARELGLAVIPLVQSLGHMETPLRIDDYAPLRELPDRIDGLNPLAPRARELVQRMVDDVIERSGPITHFHLGGDEAFTFGQHPDTRQYIAEHGRASLYLHHVRPILESLNARGIRPILWHDMMREWDERSLARLAELADVMVWAYQDGPDEAMMERFQRAGVVVWGASAYKGADSRGDAELPNVARRTANALAWAGVATRQRLAGVIATGWSRYQTTRVQCEPIDGALDSLIRTAGAFHDGHDIGALAAERSLASIGELESFRACHGALARLSEARRSAWEFVRLYGEQVSLERDPKRRGSGVTEELVRLAREQVSAADIAAVAVRAAMSERVPRVWIESFLAERLDPLKNHFSDMNRVNRY
jgi:hexosaminidase